MKIYCLSIHNKHYNFFKKYHLTPVGLGNNLFDNKWIDDKGFINISEKNKNFGEYTFHYSLWKNGDLDKIDEEWIGFCTYRRFWVKKNIRYPQSISELGSSIINKTPKEWKNYETILANPIRPGKQKIMKIIKNNFLYALKKPKIFFKENSIEDHFNIFHEPFFLEEALELLNPNLKKGFKEYLQSYEFNPHNLFICKNVKLLKEFYSVIFPWIFKCEKKFQHLNLNTYGKKRIYGFLAERFMPFWFRKNSKVLEWPYIFFDTNMVKKKIY